MHFLKMHGLGNDFVIVDVRKGLKTPTKAQIAAISDRRTSVGCDQFIVLEPSKKADVFMRIYNPDGEQAEACGNATRCVGSLIMDELKTLKAGVETVAGVLTCTREPDGRITTDMGIPKFGWKEIPLSHEVDTLNLPLGEGGVAVNVGNPHAVFFVDNVETINVKKLGQSLENHALFPQKCNIEFAQILSPGKIRMRVWERGTGETRACGSGACATVIASVRKGLGPRKSEIILDGGVLNIEWRESDDHVLMTGAVSHAFDGELKEI